MKKLQNSIKIGIFFFQLPKFLNKCCIFATAKNTKKFAVFARTDLAGSYQNKIVLQIQ